MPRRCCSRGGRELSGPGVVALVGATASGKTAAAIAVAERLPVEVVSADSRQIRRGMRIGTAAPTDEELAAAPHHLVGIVEPDAPWTLADFLARAHETIDAIHARGRLPLLVGGAGQYVWALLEGWQPPAVEPNWELRAHLEREAREHGVEAVHARLAALDPASAERIGTTNQRRLIRALEIVEATGEPIGPLPRVPPSWPWRVVGLQWSRSALNRRSGRRAEAMYATGLVEETREVIARHGEDFEALRSIGYAEALGVLHGQWDEAEAIGRTQAATRRLIRRQAAWFRPVDPRIEWVAGADVEGVVGAVEATARELRT